MQLFPRARVIAGTLVATATLASTALVPGLGVPGAGAQTADATTTEAAGSWLADQLVDGDHMEIVFGTDSFNDFGLTIDVIFALAEAGVAETFAADATAFMAESANTSGYIGDGTDEAYAGATAKLALLAQVRGLDPTAWGEDGIDLIDRLQGLENAEGRFVDRSAFGDFANSIGQSLAIIVQARAGGVDPTTESIQVLLQSQCADGGFALALQPDPASCVSGVDTTAIALQAIITLIPETEAVSDAIDYLLGAQQSDGGFATAASGTPNANSTGIAAQALTAAGEPEAAAAGVAYLESLQNGCSATADQGGIAFDAAGFDIGTAPRATAQALLGMGGVSFIDLSSADAVAEQPRFACQVEVPVVPETPETPTTPETPVVPDAGTPAPAPGTPVVVSPAPAATAVRANPTFAG